MSLHELMPWNWGDRSAPVRHRPRDPFVVLRQEMNRLMDAVGRGLPLGSWAGPWGTFAPRISVFEKEGAVVVEAELPGLGADDVEVLLQENVLTLKGEKQQGREEEKDGYCYSECSHGSFLRRIPLPSEVDEAKADAAFKNGVLTVVVPKTSTAASEAKRIKVKKG